MSQRRYACRDCKFWNETGALPPGAGTVVTVAVGECRHAPPTGNPRSWPVTFEADWCGRIEVNLSAHLPPPPPPPPPPKPRVRDWPLPPDGVPRRLSLSLEGIEPPVTPVPDDEPPPDPDAPEKAV
jgi:hypothetical protein